MSDDAEAVQKLVAPLAERLAQAAICHVRPVKRGSERVAPHRAFDKRRTLRRQAVASGQKQPGQAHQHDAGAHGQRPLEYLLRQPHAVAGAQRGADEQRVGQAVFHKAQGGEAILRFKRRGITQLPEQPGKTRAFRRGRLRDDRRPLPRRHSTPSHPHL